jgi:hypothetical protein
MLNYYGDFRTTNHFGTFATASLFAPAQGFLNSLVYFYRASKGGSQTWNWRNLFGLCLWKGSSASELSSTEIRPSTTTGHTVTVGTVDSSQEHPSEAMDTIEESREHNTPTNVAESEMGAAEIGRESQESESDEFSAAAEHWLMEALDVYDESTQPTRAAPSRLPARAVFDASMMAPNRQPVIIDQSDENTQATTRATPTTFLARAFSVASMAPSANRQPVT